MSRRLHFILVKKGIMPNAHQSPNRAALLVAQLVKNLPAMQESWVRTLGWEDPPEKGKAYLFQYSGLENSMDCIVHGVIKSQT